MAVIKLDCGRNITLERLQQEKTYANLLEGTPRKTFNDEIIARWRKQANQHEYQRMVLIEPVRKPGWSAFNRPEADAMWGPPEMLPLIVCVGMFQSAPVRNEREDFSLLNIVWFQDDFALPIDAGVIAQIRGVDWENLAYNWTM